MVTAIGLPVLALSTATSSSARASMASAMRNRARLRSDGVASRQPGKAAAAAAKAASTSSDPDTGASKFSSPVHGSTNVTDVPDLGLDRGATDEVRQAAWWSTVLPRISSRR